MNDVNNELLVHHVKLCFLISEGNKPYLQDFIIDWSRVKMLYNILRICIFHFKTRFKFPIGNITTYSIAFLTSLTCYKLRNMTISTRGKTPEVNVN